jgi:1-acyl-sn-glycerol-3-phosphate acyltransferase
VPLALPSFRAPARASGLALATVARLGAATVHQRLVPKDKRDAVFDRHMRAWCNHLLKMFAFELLVDPGPLPPSSGPRLVVANHRSPADIVVLLTLFGGQFLGQANIARWPILGAAATKAGTVWVDRGRGTSGASAIRAIRRRLEQGATMLVFPEGTTFGGDQVHPFRTGALGALRGLQVEVVPVGLAYDAGVEWVDGTFMHHLQQVASRKSTRVAVRLGAPFRSTGAEDSKALAERLRGTVQELVVQAREQHSLRG